MIANPMVDLNCDMGESFGPWQMGDDRAIMPWITSASIACGGHAGDPDVMAATVRLAQEHNVAVGAHPGYPDLRGFGRRPLRLGPDEVLHMILYQLGALWGVARGCGAELRHVKPHGALYNSACEDRVLASSVAEAVKRFSMQLPLVGLPGSQIEVACGELGVQFAAEGFADRRYEPNGSLRSRTHEDALLTDRLEASMQAQNLAAGFVVAHDGARLSMAVDTICIHGDTPGAPAIAHAVNEALRSSGYLLSPLRTVLGL